MARGGGLERRQLLVTVAGSLHLSYRNGSDEVAKVVVVCIKLVVSQFHRVVVQKHMLPYTSAWSVHDAFDLLSSNMCERLANPVVTF